MATVIIGLNVLGWVTIVAFVARHHDTIPIPSAWASA
jgi:hypothetical protein